MDTKYSTAQKLCLAGCAFAGILILVGGGSPFWIVSDPGFGTETVGSLISSLTNYLIKGYMGLYMVCLESKAYGETSCKFIEIKSDSGWFLTCRAAASICILMACINGICALSLACCNCCRRFIALGISEFIAAAFGAFALGSFARNTEIITSDISGFKVSSYGWGFYIFLGGVIVMGVVSFTACFAGPNNALRGMILSHAPASVIVQTSSTMSNTPYYHLQNQQDNMVHVNAGNNGFTPNAAF